MLVPVAGNLAVTPKPLLLNCISVPYDVLPELIIVVVGLFITDVF